MLKEVMIGSGGILLAAAVVASSITPGTSPAPVPSQDPALVAAPQVAAATPQAQSAPTSPEPIFPDQTGDMQFGAPMIEAVPVENAYGDAPASFANPDSAEANGGRQFYARPGQPNPIPR